MAKKREKASAPKVTSLPLPISDTPLVIDLPDGQKIVIGKMQQGSVIEVATWRGTGRPDSRTNRLMMGMNNGDTSPTPPESGYTSEKSDEIQTSDLKTKVLIEIKRLVGQTRTLLSQLILQLKKRKSSATKIQTASEESASGLAFASEVDEWLKKVLERSERKSVGALKKTASTPKKVAKTVKKSAHKKSKRKS
jgi:HAMP domain-containing protein